MTQAVSSPHYTADIQGYSQDLVDGVTYFKVLVTENGARQWFVGRRYTDFEHLAEGLRLLLPGMPPMPPKSFFRRKFLPSFMSERQLALGNLLRHALRADPTLSCLPPLRQFLGTQDAAAAPGGMAGLAQMQPAYSAPAYAQAAAPPLAPYAAPAAQAVPIAPAHLAPPLMQAAPVMQGTPVAQAHYLPHEPAYEQPYYEEEPSHSSGMGKVVGVGVAAGAAGLVGGMLLEGALESHRQHELDAMFRDGGFPPLPGGPGFFGGPGLLGSEEVRTEVIDRDMFGRVEDVRETIVDRDAFGDVTREEVFVDDGW